MRVPAKVNGRRSSSGSSRNASGDGLINVIRQPFCRRRVSSSAEEERFVSEVIETLTTLSSMVPDSDMSSELVPRLQARYAEKGCLNQDDVTEVSDIFASRWKLKDEHSEVAFKGLLLILEHCLSYELINHASFQHFVETLGFHTVFFWKKAVPVIYDSDMQYGTNFRDALLFSLVLYDVNEGKNRLRELFAAVPGLRDSLLGKPAKRFEEAFHHMVQRRTSQCASTPGGSEAGADLQNPDELLEDLLPLEDGEQVERESIGSERRSCGGGSGVPRSTSDIIEENAEWNPSQNSPRPDGSPEPGMDSIITSGSVGTGHFDQRVINVSNAPPVSLKQKKGSGQWELGQGSGGLVSCCAPVMSQDSDNIWLACFGPAVPIHQAVGSRPESPLAPAVNSLGLPILHKTNTQVLSKFLQGPPDEIEEGDALVAEDLSLLNVLKNFSKDNYKLNPVLVSPEDYNVYYGGISNGLLWPALHNLQEYILKEYDDLEVVEENWRAYIRVNYQFALNAVRNSRPQDFLWIHDYHLMLAGLIIQSLDSHLDVGFFLHIPFQPPEIFFEKFGPVGPAILRGLLRFTKVGFQTHRDRATFLDYVAKYIPTAKIEFNPSTDKATVKHSGWTSSHGVFPVSIKNEEYLVFVTDPEVQEHAEQIRKEIFGERKGKFFFGVERFDYTKGIEEKLKAYKRFLEKHPERWGQDVYLQIAVTNRRSVETYKAYQDNCLALAKEINDTFKCAEDPDWKPLIFRLEGLPRPKLIAHYLAMNVGVVTPRRDGMNLVAKEMVICNPNCALMISVGAGTEQQLSNAGFFTETEQCYHRVEDLANSETFADIFYAAAIEPQEKVTEHGEKLCEFLKAHDIHKWSEAFLDPSWTHETIQVIQVASLNDFYALMTQTRDIRRQIVERVLKSIPLRGHFGVSLKNALESLQTSCAPDTTTLRLQENSDVFGKAAVLDVSNEIYELEQDLAFLAHLQREDPENVEQFLTTLAKYHPISPEDYSKEIDEVITLIAKGDHFQYFFTDRDGTLKAYSCSYPASVQPCYSGIIQGTFANRCTQYAAIITSAPLLNIGILDVTVIPDGYYCYGASVGREWYIDASKKFKDGSLSDEEIEMLDRCVEAIQALLEKPKHRAFMWIGSGLQRHYGHITIARQDCFGTVDEKESSRWYENICTIVNRIDPSGKVLHVHDTPTDIKISLRSKLSGRLFHKGHGIRLFAEKMELNLSEGNILVCGDSETDLPMLQEVLMLNPENTYTVWVTRNSDLISKVEGLCRCVGNSNYAFVSCPEVILGAMAQATIREVSLRPVQN